MTSPPPSGEDPPARRSRAEPKTPADAPRRKAVPGPEGHRARLRERFLAHPEALPDYEVLELLLCLARPRGDVKPLAKVLLAEFGTFAAVIAASPEALRRVEGVGDAAVAALKVAEMAAQRLLQGRVMNQPILASWDRLLEYCHARLDHQPTEHVRGLFLDTRNRLIADEEMQRGTVNHAPLYPREVVRRALELHAAAVILVHNHPSGDPTPSAADHDITLQVRDGLRAVGITLHDHLVIGRNGHVSFRSQGLF
ncbi:RadC family protein [Pararhodospirillum oryzae]|uniref:DNA repair protein RadC n=1 Tax=Pararhodospirillum oryzae TaxID=478448 RepID=A0A512H518_9PROT|nr:DNA repair protein RadC [Pararhodospirillum oryzae]GEO80514.1 DNA repair protein RadC [Pararhodospirillum oryzae]